MKSLITALLAYIAVLGMGFVIDVSEIPVEHKFMLAILVSLVFAALIIRLSKRMTELENTVFVVVLTATLAISWTLRDIERGKFSPYTIIILLALAVGIARVVYLLIRTKREVTNYE